jgi:hypothetical protein
MRAATCAARVHPYCRRSPKETQEHGRGDRRGLFGRLGIARWLYWLPVRDMLSMLVWLVGGLGKRVSRRGQDFFIVPSASLDTGQKNRAPIGKSITNIGRKIIALPRPMCYNFTNKAKPSRLAGPSALLKV